MVNKCMNKCFISLLIKKIYNEIPFSSPIAQTYKNEGVKAYQIFYRVDPGFAYYNEKSGCYSLPLDLQVILDSSLSAPLPHILNTF